MKRFKIEDYKLVNYELIYAMVLCIIAIVGLLFAMTLNDWIAMTNFVETMWMVLLVLDVVISILWIAFIYFFVEIIETPY